MTDPWVWYIDLPERLNFYGKLVGKSYTSLMDPMGMDPCT